MDRRRVARGLAGVVAAAAVVVAAPAVLYVLAARGPDDRREVAELTREAEAITQRGGRKGAPSLLLALRNPVRAGDKLDKLAYDPAISDLWKYARFDGTRFEFEWRKSPAGSTPFFHGAEPDWSRFRETLFAVVYEKFRRGTRTAGPGHLTSQMLQALDDWEDELLGPNPPAVEADAREGLCQWAVVRAYHEGDRERANQLLIQYLRSASRSAVSRCQIPCVDEWEMRSWFILLLADRGLLDAPTLAGLEQAVELANLTEDEYATLQRWARLEECAWFREAREEAGPIASPLVEAATGQLTRAILRGDSSGRPFADLSLVGALVPAQGGLFGFVGQESQAKLAPWMTTARANAQSSINMLRFILAALRYEQDHGCMPATDQDLIPGYLPADFCAESHSRWTVESVRETDTTDLETLAALAPHRSSRSASGMIAGVPAYADGSPSLCLKARPVFVRYGASSIPGPGQQTYHFAAIWSAAGRKAVEEAARSGPRYGYAQTMFLINPSRWDAMVGLLDASRGRVLPGS